MTETEQKWLKGWCTAVHEMMPAQPTERDFWIDYIPGRSTDAWSKGFRDACRAAYGG